MAKKELEPLLLDANQVRQLTGLTVETLVNVQGFPHPVFLERVPYDPYSKVVTRNLWKRSDIEKWINKLAWKAK